MREQIKQDIDLIEYFILSEEKGSCYPFYYSYLYGNDAFISVYQ